MKHNIRIQHPEDAHSPKIPGLQKIAVDVAPYDDDPSWPPVNEELLWAEPLTDGLYRIDNVPFFARDLSVNDVVTVRRADGNGAPRLDRILKRGRHSTYRVIVKLDLDEDHHTALHELLKTLSDFGCSFESASPVFFAVDIPQSRNLDAIYDVLKVGEEKSIWDFEEGHCYRGE